MRLKRSVRSVGTTLRHLSTWYTRYAPHSSPSGARSDYLLFLNFSVFLPLTRLWISKTYRRDSGRMSECLMPDMRSPRFASEISTNPALLQSIRYPTVSRRVRRCVEGEYQGRHVAVKVLRVYTTSDLDKIASVGPHSVTKKLTLTTWYWPV